AALTEFAAHGLAGARCDAIAHRARVNPRMLFYCFGSKENLYREILRRKFAQRAAVYESAPDDLAGAILHWNEAGAADLEWVRLLEWESLSATGDELVGEDERRAYFKGTFARLRRAQAHRRIPAEIDLMQLQISIIALTLFPLAFPHMMRLATGLSPTDPRFRRKRIQFLRWLGARLAGNSAVAQRTRGRVVKASRPARAKV
ncbi:MAG: TetR/AcrR family transcriptional regulator, partial [Candidatus Binataceae bacterium]